MAEIRCFGKESPIIIEFSLKQIVNILYGTCNQFKSVKIYTKQFLILHFYEIARIRISQNLDFQNIRDSN